MFQRRSSEWFSKNQINTYDIFKKNWREYPWNIKIVNGNTKENLYSLFRVFLRNVVD